LFRNRQLWASRLPPALRLPYHLAMRHPLRLFAVLGVAGVVLLAAVVVLQQRPRPERRGAPAAQAPEPAEPGGDVVARALDLARSDSVRLKERWVDEIPDLELAALPGPARATFLRIANGRRCDCGCGYTLAGCRRFDSTCDASGSRARALYDSVRDGRITRADDFPPPPASAAP
jgi:hypothetical protein